MPQILKNKQTNKQNLLHVFLSSALSEWWSDLQKTGLTDATMQDGTASWLCVDENSWIDSVWGKILTT